MAKRFKITVTEKERFIILMSLRIAAEDGSIYGGADTEDEPTAEVKRINAAIERIEAKLAW